MDGEPGTHERLTALVGFLEDGDHGGARARRFEQIMGMPLADALGQLLPDGEIDCGMATLLLSRLDAARFPFESDPAWRGPGSSKGVTARDTGALANTTTPLLQLRSALERSSRDARG